MAEPQTIAQAEALLAISPHPNDMAEQLDVLRRQTPEEWLERFDELYEAIAAAEFG